MSGRRPKGLPPAVRLLGIAGPLAVLLLLSWRSGLLAIGVVAGLVGGRAYQRRVDRAVHAQRTAEQLRLEQEGLMLQTTALAINEADDLESALDLVLSTVCVGHGWVLGQ